MERVAEKRKRSTDDPIVRLNVGGRIFETHKSVLGPSAYFGALLDRRWSGGKNETIFIDRDPDNFRHVLAFLRDVNHSFPCEIEYEFDFYGVPLVVDMTPKSRKASAPPLISAVTYRKLREKRDTLHATGALTLLAAPKPTVGIPTGVSNTKRSVCVTCTVKAQGGGSRWGVSIPRCGDSLGDIIISFGLRGGVKSRNGVVERISLKIGGATVDEISGELLEIIENTSSHPDVRRFREQLDASIGALAYRPPFTCCEAAYTSVVPMISLTYHDVSVEVVLKSPHVAVDPQVCVNQYVLENEERRRLATQAQKIPVIQHPTGGRKIRAGATVCVVDLPSGGAMTDIFWGVKDPKGAWVAVPRVSLTVGGHTWMEMDERAVREHMLEEGGYSDCPVYSWNIRRSACVDTTMFPELRFTMEWDQPLEWGGEAFVAVRMSNVLVIASGMGGLRYKHTVGPRETAVLQ